MLETRRGEKKMQQEEARRGKKKKKEKNEEEIDMVREAEVEGIGRRKREE